MRILGVHHATIHMRPGSRVGTTLQSLPALTVLQPELAHCTPFSALFQGSDFAKRYAKPALATLL